MAMNNLCRTCLGSPQKLVELVNNSDIITKIESIASIEVIMHDSLPNSVCEECEISINKLYNFRKVIQHSDLELKKHLHALENANQKLIKQQIESENGDIKIIGSNDIDTFETIETHKSGSPKLSTAEKEPSDSVFDLQEADDRSSDSEMSTESLSKQASHTTTNEGVGTHKFKKTQKQYSCEKCDFTCMDRMVWRKHQLSIHYECVSCKVCNKMVRRGNLTRHMKNHLHGYVCRECGESYKSYNDLKAHRAEKHKRLKLPCTICGKVFYYKATLSRHVKLHCATDKEIKISDTNSIEADKEHLQSPKISKPVPGGRSLHSGEKRHKCETCLIIFSRKGNLLRHQRLHTNERPFECDTCGKKFMLKHDLGRHQQRIHSNERPFACDVCGALFKVKCALKRHTDRVHTPRLKIHAKLKCEICEKPFWSNRELDIHHRTHTGERPYMCEICGKLFKSYSAVRSHMINMHSKDGNLQDSAHPLLKCQVCGKTFKWKYKLTEHERVHTKERPYVCGICGKSFTQSSAKNGHIRRIHNEGGAPNIGAEPKHRCSVCAKAFWQKSKLVRHFRVHTGERPFGCDICGRTFRQKTTLTVHARNVHNQN